MVEAKIAKLLGPRELIFESEHIDENALGSDEVLCKTLARWERNKPLYAII